MVRFETSLGDFTLELDAEKAPITVANFLEYVDEGFFDGLIFHRVIPGFMIQGGGFTPDMSQKKGKAPIKNEAKNGLQNARGTIAMARTSVVDSASSQFFINLKDNDFLDHQARPITAMPCSARWSTASTPSTASPSSPPGAQAGP